VLNFFVWVQLLLGLSDILLQCMLAVVDVAPVVLGGVVGDVVFVLGVLVWCWWGVLLGVLWFGRVLVLLVGVWLFWLLCWGLLCWVLWGGLFGVFVGLGFGLLCLFLGWWGVGGVFCGGCCLVWWLWLS
ncbi:hypothetical protein, partial [Pseudomonas syringae group genomosp. 7]|uniref:hypothetical protein n=1 Tax=Pseudomonas syringae group genomosp. 7 TaxID=251699 RepID=UPI00376F8204